MPISLEGKKNINILVFEEDHEFLAVASRELGCTQGDLIHILFEQVRLILGSAMESGLIAEDTMTPAIESYVALNMRSLGLLGDEEFLRAIDVAEAFLGKRADLRLRALEQFANERLDQLRPAWAALRAEREERNAVKREAARSVSRMMLEADAAMRQEKYAQMEAEVADIMEGNDEAMAYHAGKAEAGKRKVGRPAKAAQ